MYDKFAGRDDFETIMNELTQPGTMPYGRMKELSRNDSARIDSGLEKTGEYQNETSLT